MAIERSYVTILFLFVRTYYSVCQASNTSYVVPPSETDPSASFVVGTSNIGSYPFQDSSETEVKILQSLTAGHDIGNTFGVAVNHKRIPGSVGGRKNDSTLSLSSKSYEDSLGLHLNAVLTNGKWNEIQNTASLDQIRDKAVHAIEKRSSELSKKFSSTNFSSLESALLSLAFLTFAVFVIDLVQDLFRGTSASRKRRSSESDEGMTDVIVLALSSLDTFSYGSQNPVCGQKLLCHLNRSGWHDGLLGSASNYIVSLFLSVFSPKSGFQKNLDAAQFGKESEECTERYAGCPSVLGEMLPS